jgi:hypothetical protein
MGVRVGVLTRYLLGSHHRAYERKVQGPCILLFHAVLKRLISDPGKKINLIICGILEQ